MTRWAQKSFYKAARLTSKANEVKHPRAKARGLECNHQARLTRVSLGTGKDARDQSQRARQYCRTNPTLQVFPRGYLTYPKRVWGFQAADMVRVEVPKGNMQATTSVA
jgi:hypothetical protein